MTLRVTSHRRWADGSISELIHLANRRLDQQGRLPGHVPAVRKLSIVCVRDATGVEAAVLLAGARPTEPDALARAQRSLQQRSKLLNIVAPMSSSTAAAEESISAVELVGSQSRPVTVRTTLPDALPEMLVGRRSVVLDIDEDFFVLGPRETARDDSADREILQDVQTVMEHLSRAGLRPDMVSIALSPGCTPEAELVGSAPLCWNGSLFLGCRDSATLQKS